MKKSNIPNVLNNVKKTIQELQNNESQIIITKEYLENVLKSLNDNELTSLVRGENPKNIDGDYILDRKTFVILRKVLQQNVKRHIKLNKSSNGK